MNGLFNGFVAACFVDLAVRLGAWAQVLKPGGWCLIVEVDDLFGHGPLSTSARNALARYAKEARAATTSRWGADSRARWRPRASPSRARSRWATPSWRSRVQVARAERFERVAWLRAALGAACEAAQKGFLAAMADPQHTCTCRVVVCLGRLDPVARAR